MTEEKQEERVVLHNRGNRVIKTKFGVLEIGGSLEVPASGAKELLDYRGVVDAAKLVPQNVQTIDRLKSRIAELETANDRLRSENEAPAAPKKDAEPVKEKEPAAPVSGKKSR